MDRETEATGDSAEAEQRAEARTEPRPDRPPTTGGGRAALTTDADAQQDDSVIEPGSS